MKFFRIIAKNVGLTSFSFSPYNSRAKATFSYTVMLGSNL